MNEFWFWISNFWWMYISVFLGMTAGEFLFKLYQDYKNEK